MNPQIGYSENTPGGILFMIGFITVLCTFSVMAYRETGKSKFFAAIVFTGFVGIVPAIDLIYHDGPERVWQVVATVVGSVALVYLSRWWNGY